ncbi:hypothetical protein ANN_23408 [Periplaneta americana]|uniref:Uncharacterized protein n=1 Tax=Periplaneta americana TaxID=6978 RepID=A0ABQ8SMB1_PERAM|nr:hypothetical protein ANN_23408 [Periplaneta americana]
MRYTAGYTKWDHKRSEDVMEELQLEHVVNHVKHYRNNWINHLHRMRRDRIPKVMLHYRPNGKRSLGRPKKRWIEYSTLHWQQVLTDWLFTQGHAPKTLALAVKPLSRQLKEGKADQAIAGLTSTCLRRDERSSNEYRVLCSKSHTDSWAFLPSFLCPDRARSHAQTSHEGKTLEERDSIWCYGLNFGVAQCLEHLVRRTMDPDSNSGAGTNFSPLITIKNIKKNEQFIAEQITLLTPGRIRNESYIQFKHKGDDDENNDNFLNYLFNDAVSTTRLFSVDEIGDSEMVFGEMRPRIRDYLAFTLCYGCGKPRKNPNQLPFISEGRLLYPQPEDAPCRGDKDPQYILRLRWAGHVAHMGEFEGSEP